MPKDSVILGPVVVLVLCWFLQLYHRHVQDLEYHHVHKTPTSQTINIPSGTMAFRLTLTKYKTRRWYSDSERGYLLLIQILLLLATRFLFYILKEYKRSLKKTFQWRKNISCSHIWKIPKINPGHILLLTIYNLNNVDISTDRFQCLT